VSTCHCRRLVAQALAVAAQEGDVAALGRLLDGGADPNALAQVKVDDPTRPGQKLRSTALLLALKAKQEAAVRRLLERGADPSLADSTGMTPLMNEAGAGSLAGVRLLLARRAALDCAELVSGFTAFHLACLQGHADVAEALVRAGCDTTLRAKNGRTGREVAMQLGHTAVVRAIDAAVASVAAGEEPQPEPAPAPPELAAGTAVVIVGLVGAPQHNGKGGIVEGFDAAKGRHMVRVIGEAITMNLKPANLQRGLVAQALAVAAQEGDVAAMGRLLDGGADPNALAQVKVDDPTRPGQKLRSTALLLALKAKQEAAAQLLLERGADPSLANSMGMTPLMHAVTVTGSLAGVQLLVARGVALDCAQPDTGVTAFHSACFTGYADVAEALVRAGCDTTLRDKYDMTGRQLAIKLGHTAVVRAIDAAAASP
jgi:ankyrin repeat protein